MTALLRCMRPLIGNRFFALLVVLALIAGTLPARAQSPVANPTNPTIKVVYLYEQVCAAGVDPSAGSLQDAVDACPQSLEGVAFTLASQDPTYPSETHPTNAIGDTEFREIPSGIPYTIQESIPQGYGDPWVRCQFCSNLDSTIPDTERSFQAAGGYMDIGLSDPALDDYLEVACYWFDMPDSAGVQAAQADADGARLDIRAWQCPFHFDAAVATVEELVATCNRPHRDANFIINGDPATQQYTGDIGAVSYPSVPFGTVTIQQLAYASYDPARVFCYTLGATASHGPLLASQEIGFTTEPGDTFSVTIQVDPGEAIDCIWFDARVTEDDLGSVLIHKYVCPDGTNTAAFDMDLLLHACPEPQVAYFQLLFGGGSSSGNETDANGYLGFINYTPGTYPIREISPLGYVPARIFCRSYNADDWNHIVDPWVEQTIDSGIGFTVQIQAHWETECTWFDVKGVNYGYLDIAARSCPLDFTPNASTPRDTFAQQCQTGVTGAQFDINSYPNLETDFTSTDGYALFQEPVTVGYLTISSTDPQTYSFVRAFCGDAPFIGIGAIPTNWTSYAIGFTQYTVPVNYQVVCEFYYRPIAIVAGAEGVEAEASPADIASASDEEESATTDEKEAAAVEASPEVIPSEESTSESGDSQGGQSGSTGGNQGASGGTGSPSGGSGTASRPPADASAPATLTLVTFTCPPGYDLYTGDAVPSGDCPDPAIGIDFTVTGQDEPAQQATSNAGGELAWTGLAPGAYLLQAALPPETDRAFIADCVSDQRTFTVDNPLNPFAYAGPEGQIGITLLPGEVLACSWYDIPAGQGGAVTGQLFSCPGTTVIKAQCTPAPGPATLHFDPAPGEGVVAFEVQIGEDAPGQTVAAAGTYALTGLPTTACLIESDAFDASGQLVVTEDAAVEIRVYICGG